MTDPGYTSPFISRMPGIPASMEDDQEPEYEYKDKLDEDDDIWEWEKCDDYHKEWRGDDDDGDKPDPIDDGLWGPVLWMAGICGAIMILYGLLG